MRFPSLFSLLMLVSMFTSCSSGEIDEQKDTRPADSTADSSPDTLLADSVTQPDTFLDGDGTAQDVDLGDEPDSSEDTDTRPDLADAQDTVADTGDVADSDTGESGDTVNDLSDTRVDTEPDTLDTRIDTEPDTDTSDSGDLPICQEVPAPEPASPEPLDALTPPGRVETTSVDGFTDDYLYDPDDYLKVGTRREWGATLIFYGIDDDDPGTNGSNTIDSNDTGREVQIALYDPTRAMQGCAHNATCQTHPETACPTSIRYLGWNPVQGGNRCNNGSGVESVSVTPGKLEAEVIPLFWNPDWERTDCSGDGCSNPSLRYLESDVSYTQRLRFVRSHVVEMQMTVVNLSAISHPATAQEFPTLYATFGQHGTPDLRVLLNSEGQVIPIDQPANDGFFYKNFESPGGWVSLQTLNRDYGVGLYYENRMTSFQGWQKYGVFNNFRSIFSFGLPANGMVRARAYLLIGSFTTIAGLAADLDATLPPFGVLDAPESDTVVSGSMLVRGWALDNKGVSSIEALLDGQSRGTTSLAVARPDVCAVYPGYAQCNTVGYSLNVGLDGVTPCPHLLEIAAIDTDGNRRVIARKRIFVQ